MLQEEFPRTPKQAAKDDTLMILSQLWSIVVWSWNVNTEDCGVPVLVRSHFGDNKAVRLDTGTVNQDVYVLCKGSECRYKNGICLYMFRQVCLDKCYTTLLSALVSAYVLNQ
ncbi:hypothetical protein J1614_002026 [Plenodomus biglobosus]|nr:hypothetical protein J1614_002026 [Plenodomus biglobosus]